MAYMQSQLDKLDAAIARGELEVSDGDTRVRYRSIDDMIKARNHIVSLLNASSGDGPSKLVRVNVSKGVQ
jgi:hypothetical protein